VVRYGNVVGSRGSVVPLFKRLLAQGATELPITDPRMTRFWITLNEGVDFVLSSLELMRGGEIFVPKIPSMTMPDLVKAMSPDAGIKVIGIRPGEKLHEMMISADDARATVELADRYAIEPAFAEYPREPFAAADGAKPVAEGFSYSSDSNDEWLSGRACWPCWPRRPDAPSARVLPALRPPDHRGRRHRGRRRGPARRLPDHRPDRRGLRDRLRQKVGRAARRGRANGTATLHLAMLALGVGEGEVCIVPSVTFLATANCARYVGAEVVFADVDPDSGLMTPDTLAAALARAGQRRVRAVLPVHLRGDVCDLPALGPWPPRPARCWSRTRPTPWATMGPSARRRPSGRRRRLFGLGHLLVPPGQDPRHRRGRHAHHQ
jgi:hypothetical protein